MCLHKFKSNNCVNNYCHIRKKQINVLKSLTDTSCWQGCKNEVHLRMHTHKSGFPMPWPNGTLTYDRWWKSSALLIMLLEHDRVASTESFLWWGTQRCLLASSLNTDQKTNPPGIETPPPGLNFQYLPPSATHNVCDGMSRVGGWVDG